MVISSDEMQPQIANDRMPTLNEHETLPVQTPRCGQRLAPRWVLPLAAACLALLALASPGYADGPSTQPTANQFKVATKVAAPFALQDGAGRWHGLSIELWRDIAAELQIDYEFHEVELANMLQSVRDGQMDAAVAAITVTAEREKLVDFTHPIYSTGLGIAVRPPEEKQWYHALYNLFSWAFAMLIVVLTVVLLCVGMLVWMFERRHNADFDGRPARGIANAFWWSAVTMTTVGYGDKTPRSLFGRLLAIAWMFSSIILISAFTASVTSTLTVPQLRSRIEGPADLPKVRVACIEASTSHRYLMSRGISNVPCSDITTALNSLQLGKVDAVVHDAPILRYHTLRSQDPIRVLPGTFQRQDYAFALPPGSPLREPMNRIILRKLSEPAWRANVLRYLGESHE